MAAVSQMMLLAGRGPLVTTLIPAATGTIINLFFNGRGGAAAAFDSNTNQTQNAGAGSGASPGATDASSSGYNNALGKDWGAGNDKIITRFKIYGPNNNNVLTGTTTTTKLQGSPDNSAWTDLYTTAAWGGSSSATIDVTSGITVTTAYRYHRLNSNGDGSNSLFYAEIEFYEDI